MKCKWLLCPPICQWRRGESFTVCYSQNGLRVDLEPSKKGESFLCFLHYTDSKRWVKYSRLLQVGEVPCNRKSLPVYSEYSTCGALFPVELLISSLAGKSPYVSLCWEKRTICILQKLLKLMPRWKKRIEAWKNLQERWKCHGSFDSEKQAEAYVSADSIQIPLGPTLKEEETSDLWAPEHDQTPAPMQSSPRGSF